MVLKQRQSTLAVAAFVCRAEEVSFFLAGLLCGFDPVPGGGSSSGENPRHLCSRPLSGLLASGVCHVVQISSAVLDGVDGLVSICYHYHYHYHYGHLFLLGPRTGPDNGACCRTPSFQLGGHLGCFCWVAAFFCCCGSVTAGESRDCHCAVWVRVGVGGLVHRSEREGAGDGCCWDGDQLQHGRKGEVEFVP